MKKIIVSLVMLTTIAFAGNAQNSKQEKIKLLFKEMHQDSLMIKTLEVLSSSRATQMTTLFKDSLFSNTGVDYAKMVQQITARNSERLKQLTLRLLNEDLVAIYDKYFTGEEIDELRKFYGSKAGQKLLMNTPAISKDVMAIISSKYLPDFQQAYMKDLKEIIKDASQ